MWQKIGMVGSWNCISKYHMHWSFFNGLMSWSNICMLMCRKTLIFTYANSPLKYPSQFSCWNVMGVSGMMSNFDLTYQSLQDAVVITDYHKVSNIRRTLVGNKIFDHSDVVGASPAGAAPTTSSFSTWHLASMDWAKTTARRDEKHSCFGIGCILY